MDDNGPSWTDAVWRQNPVFSPPSPPDTARTGETSVPEQPSFDSAEPWTDLPLPDGTAIGSILVLADRLREAGIPVRSAQVRRSGFLGKGKANVILSVPERMFGDADGLVAKHFADR